MKPGESRRSMRVGRCDIAPEAEPRHEREIRVVGMAIKHKQRGKAVTARSRAFRTFAALTAAYAAISLAACGGGGGGGEAGTAGFPVMPQQLATAPPASVPAPEPLPTSGPIAAPPAAADPVVGTVTLTGKVTYDSVPNRNGPLVYADTVAKPVRAASVEILDAKGALVAAATTDDSGIYKATVPARTMLTVRVQAQLLRSGAGANWDVSVRDNTTQNAVYSMEAAEFPSGVGAPRRDLHAASGWGGAGYTGPRAAAPFAVMDTVYASMQKVEAAAPGTRFPALKVFWSANNLGAVGDKSLGQIGTSHFVNRITGAEMYIRGRENVDTDEFDSSVIAHEWGHYYQAAFSRDDTIGGRHAGPDRVDRRVAFSEGWGTGFSGIVLERNNFMDSTGDKQARGGGFDLSRGPQDNPGWYRELSIQHIFWSLNAQVGFKPIHDAMTSVPFKTHAPVTSIHSFAAAFNAVAPDSAPVLAALLRSQGISDAPNDPFGLLETNAGGLPEVPNVLPMHTEAQVGVAAAACVSNVAGSTNKLGNYRYLRFTAPASREYRWALAPTTEGADLAVSFYRGGVVPEWTRKAPAQPPVTVANLTAGFDYIAAVQDRNGTSACFNLTIQ